MPVLKRSLARLDVLLEEQRSGVTREAPTERALEVGELDDAHRRRGVALDPPRDLAALDRNVGVTAGVLVAGEVEEDQHADRHSDAGQRPDHREPAPRIDGLASTGATGVGGLLPLLLLAALPSIASSAVPAHCGLRLSSGPWTRIAPIIRTEQPARHEHVAPRGRRAAQAAR